jgi:hypothetical protein
VRHDPGVLADGVGTRPGLRCHGHPHRRERQVRVERRDDRPVEVRRHPAVDVVPVDPPGQCDRAGVVVVRAVLTRPDDLTGVDRVG